MSKTTVRNAGEYIRDRREFIASSLRGEWCFNSPALGRAQGSEFGYVLSGHTEFPIYVIYSYSTPIAYYYDEWVFTTEKYSTTTSRHLSTIKAAVL